MRKNSEEQMCVCCLDRISQAALQLVELNWLSAFWPNSRDLFVITSLRDVVDQSIHNTFYGSIVFGRKNPIYLLGKSR